MGLGHKIKVLRTAAGWTLEDLESKSGVASGTISALEVRDSSRSQYFPVLARTFGLTMELLEQLPVSALVASTEGNLEPGSETPRGPDEPGGVRRYPTLQPILTWEHEEDLPAGDFVLIPRLEVRLSAGHGTGLNQLEIEFADKQPQAFRADWIRREHLKPKKLAAMKADGDSMEPRIQDGDALVIDTSQIDVRDGHVYALWYDGGERVKRLFRLPGAGLRIHSDNGSKYADIVLKPDELEHVRILGRVVHVAGTGGL